MTNPNNKTIILAAVLILGIIGWSLQDSTTTNSAEQTIETHSNLPKTEELIGQRSIANTKKAQDKQAPTKQKPIRSRRQASYFDRVKHKLAKLKNCYETEGQCFKNNQDPKEEYFKIGNTIKKQILSFQDYIQRETIKNDEISGLAREFMAIQDGHVKEAALHLLSTQDISEKNLETILSEIINYHDAKLIQHAMLELTRYLETNMKDQIHQSLAKALQQGSPLVSEEISKHIHMFINQDSEIVYKNALAKLNLGGLPHRNLKTALEDFVRKQKAA